MGSLTAFEMTGIFVYIICLGILALITIGISYRAFLDTERVGAHTFGLLMFSMAVWAFFYLLEIILPEFSQKMIARKILYLGMTLSAPFWLAFAFRYTPVSAWWAKYGRNGLLAIPGAIAFLLGLSNESHHLIWQSVKMPENSIGQLQITYGPVFWVYVIISCGLSAIGVMIYLYDYIRSPKYFRKQTGVILWGVLTALGTQAVFLAGSLAGILPVNLNASPLSFAVSAPFLAVGFFRFGLFNLFPIAAPLIIENLRDAVIVVDEHDHIININLTAKKWFNLNDQTIGSAVFDILPKAKIFKERWDMADARIKFKVERNRQRAWYDAAITQLHKNNHSLIGRVIIFHDITQEQELLEAEFRHSTQMGLLEELGRQISESLTEKDILQRSMESIVNHFGYVEAAVFILTRDNQVEVAAMSGTQDFGHPIKFKQETGKGIIGHTAKTQQTYIANDISKDPYYFSTDERHGSAICIPLVNEKKLLGVLYIESARTTAFSDDDIQTLETLAHQISSAMQRARLYADTQEHLQVMSAVQSIAQVVSSSLEIENICKTVVNVLNSTFGYPYIGIYLLEEDYLQLSAQLGFLEETSIKRININQGICGKTAKTRKIQFIEDVAQKPDFLRAADKISSEICVPLLKENTVLGVLNIEGDIAFQLTQKDADILNMLAGPIALALDNARLHAQVKILAMTDAVSGLSNRHAFEETLRTEIERAARVNTSLSLIIFDIDSFKDYNDTWGHPAGDKRLRATADLIRSSLRKYDVAARYGGDEFAIILPDTDTEGSILFAKRLLATTQASAPKSATKGNSVAGYTLSIGVATFPNDGNTFEALLLAADHAELIAKRSGKNRIIIARDLDP